MARSLLVVTAALAVPPLMSMGPRPARAAGDVLFTGMCDASGAVTLPEGKFVVADDEDNVLRVYDAQRGGGPLSAADLSPELELPSKKKAPETDLEAATLLGDRALWLTSHGRNSKGKPQPSRLRLFATTAGTPPRLVGKPYTHMLEDLLKAPALARFGLQTAAEKAPKQPGALNIEGMTARPDGRSVIIGFRNPLPRGKALVVPLLNPLEMIDTGQTARLGAPQLLELEGRGIRSISFWRGRYLLIGGGIADEAVSRLYTWDGKSDRPRAIAVALDDLNPEGFASFEDRPQVLLLSDDGSREIDGQPCKKLKDPTRKRFRGRWVTVP
jgi:hypothetical protein